MLGLTLAIGALLGCLIAATAQPVIPGFTDTTLEFTHVPNMDFDTIPGGLQVTELEIRSLLTQPSSPLGDFTIIPAFDFKATVLHFNQVPTSILFDEDNLHTFNVYPFTIDLSTLVLSAREASPWIYGAWAGARLSTDFRSISGENLNFLFAAGAAYRFHDRFTLGLGGAVTNINDNLKLHPGLGLDWMITHQVHLGVCGPDWLASYIPDRNWQLGFCGESTSDFWNISDKQGQPLAIELSSYRIGAFASRRITGQLWLRASAGVSLANEFQLNDSNGDKIVSQTPNSRFFGQISLTIRSW